MRFLIRLISSIISFVLVVVAGALIWLSVTEYTPQPIEQAERNTTINTAYNGTPMRVVSWNIGYSGLGKESDFFMDGGKQTRIEDKNIVLKNMSGISNTLASLNADAYLLQEVDQKSMRSHYIDGLTQLEKNFSQYNSAFALNYSCDFVPFPWPPIGKVSSGLLTLQNLSMTEAQRISLPVPFTWPLRIANLKRCMLVTYIPIANSDKQLVLINFHLEAYDDGSGKAAQSKMLRDFMLSEYQKGNYVIAGGDFNQAFPGTESLYPVKNQQLWAPGYLDSNDLPSGWKYYYDSSAPTCRLLNQPYDPNSNATQYYIIDGFILSPNVQATSVKTQNEHFEYSDHNPVVLDVNLINASTPQEPAYYDFNQENQPQQQPEGASDSNQNPPNFVSPPLTLPTQVPEDTPQEGPLG